MRTIYATRRVPLQNRRLCDVFLIQEFGVEGTASSSLRSGLRQLSAHRLYDESQQACGCSCPSACCRREQATAEKASIDEIYLDVTGMVEAELQASTPLGGGPAPSATAGFGWGGVVIDGPLRVDNEFERRLSVGAMIACRLRGAVREQLGAPPLPTPPVRTHGSPS